MKRLAALLLGLLTMLWGACALAQEGCAALWRFYVTAEGSVFITGRTDDAKVWTIPTTLLGLPVTAVEFDTSYDDGRIALELPNGVAVVAPGPVNRITEGQFIEADGLCYRELPNGTLAVNRPVLPEEEVTGAVKIPAEVNGKRVTALDPFAFYNCVKLKEVVIPEGVTAVGDGAFLRCEKLSAVTLPDGLLSIGESCFEYCGSLKKITLPDSLLELKHYAFANSGLTEIRIPDGIRVIPDHAFFQCKQLKKVVLPKGLLSIGYRSFIHTHALKTIDLPEGLLSIGKFALHYSGLTSLTIPSSVREIGEAALQNESLSKCVFKPLYATIVNDSASGEVAIFSVFHTLSLTCQEGSIVDRDYRSNPKVKITYKTWEEVEPLPVITAPAERVLSAENFAPPTYAFALVIPEGVEEIDDATFFKAESLCRVTLPSTLKKIGASAFRECSMLSEIIIPDGVTSIGRYAFDKCTNLRRAIVGQGVTEIPNYLFFLCEALEEVVLPAGVRSIERFAFANNYSLKSINLPEGLERIGGCAFLFCDSLKEVVLPDTLTQLGDSAFASCASLRKITIPPSVTEFGALFIGGPDTQTITVVMEKGSPVDELLKEEPDWELKFKRQYR